MCWCQPSFTPWGDVDSYTEFCSNGWRVYHEVCAAQSPSAFCRMPLMMLWSTSGRIPRQRPPQSFSQCLSDLWRPTRWAGASSSSLPSSTFIWDSCGSGFPTQQLVAPSSFDAAWAVLESTVTPLEAAQIVVLGLLSGLKDNTAVWNAGGVLRHWISGRLQFAPLTLSMRLLGLGGGGCMTYRGLSQPIFSDFVSR